MLLETVRIVKDWLVDGTYGVNVLAASVPRDVGDSAPGAVTVYDETRNDQAARGRVPDGTRIVTVQVAREAETTVEASWMGPVRTKDLVPLLIVLAVRVEDSDTTTTEAYYLTRAILRSLEQLKQNVNSASRTRNNVYLLALHTVKVLPVVTPVEDKLVKVALLVECQMRDLAP